MIIKENNTIINVGIFMYPIILSSNVITGLFAPFCGTSTDVIETERT